MDDKERKRFLEKIKKLLKAVPKSKREEARSLAIVIGRGRKGDRVMKLNKLWRDQPNMSKDEFASLAEDALIALEFSEMKVVSEK